MATALKYRYFGGEGKPPLVLLHGLLGSSRNWQTIGQRLVEDYEVFALDLRNHGDSFHDGDASYRAMAADVVRWIDSQSLETVHLLGHSLGGKLAMMLALERPGRFSSLIVVDIAPRNYALHHEATFAALSRLDVGAIESRAEAESRLEADIADGAHRQFLLSNLLREPDGGFRWRVNLQALAAAQADHARNPLPEGRSYHGPVFFVRGSRSDYVRDDDRKSIGEYFPRYILSTIGEAGHNPHIENRDAFVSAIRYFAEYHLSAGQGAGDSGPCTI